MTGTMLGAEHTVISKIDTAPCPPHQSIQSIGKDGHEPDNHTNQCVVTNCHNLPLQEEQSGVLT